VITTAAQRLLQQLGECQSYAERELLMIHALTKAHLDGMDAATEIANEAIERVVLRRHVSHTEH
jgi:hypothetical protein